MMPSWLTSPQQPSGKAGAVAAGTVAAKVQPKAGGGVTKKAGKVVVSAPRSTPGVTDLTGGVAIVKTESIQSETGSVKSAGLGASACRKTVSSLKPKAAALTAACVTGPAISNESCYFNYYEIMTDGADKRILTGVVCLKTLNVDRYSFCDVI